MDGPAALALGLALAGAGAQPSSSARPPRMELSQLARELGGNPAAVDDLLDSLASRTGPLGAALKEPARREQVKEALQRSDPADLDRSPVLTAAQAAAGAALYAGRQGLLDEPNFPAELALILTHEPAEAPKDAYLTPLGHGLFRGDDSLSVPGSNWADAKAAAGALDMLSSNDPASPAHVLIDGGRRYDGVFAWLSALLAEGHALEARDRRYYANFGHLRYEKSGVRHDVTTPTRLDTGIVLPSGRALIVPVSHSEVDISIRGPRLNAELSFYFGLGGVVGFRPFDTLDMDWVGGRSVRTWTGLEAAKLLDRAGWVRRELMAKAKANALPMGGYGPLGDCNDADALVTGLAPYPMLRDPKYDQGNTAIDSLSAGLPYDLRDRPDPRRIWDSRPFEDPSDIPMPDVRDVMLELQTLLGSPQ